MLGMIAAALFAGYLLIYAAVANGGRFAAAPWEALHKSAYDGTAAGQGSAPHPSTWDQIAAGVSFLTNPLGGLFGP